MNATRKPRKPAEPAAAKPAPPPGANLILSIFRMRADDAARQLARRRAELSEAISNSAYLVNVLDGAAVEIVECEAEGQIRGRVVKAVEECVAGTTLRDRLGMVMAEADHESRSIISTQSWAVHSTNPVYNALESARVNVQLRTWVEIAEMARHFLAGEIVEDLDGPAEGPADVTEAAN